MVNKDEYINDEYDEPDNKFIPYMLRFQAAYSYDWEKDLRLPTEVNKTKYANIDLAVFDYNSRYSEYQGHTLPVSAINNEMLI